MEKQTNIFSQFFGSKEKNRNLDYTKQPFHFIPAFAILKERGPFELYMYSLMYIKTCVEKKN